MPHTIVMRESWHQNSQDSKRPTVLLNVACWWLCTPCALHFCSRAKYQHPRKLLAGLPVHEFKNGKKVYACGRATDEPVAR